MFSGYRTTSAAAFGFHRLIVARLCSVEGTRLGQPSHTGNRITLTTEPRWQPNHAGNRITLATESRWRASQSHEDSPRQLSISAR